MQSPTEKSEVKNMESQTICQISSESQVSSDINWHTLYRQLTVIVTQWVRSTSLPTWKAQREDIIDEIVQETIMRALKRIRRGESGELSPVYSVEGLCVRVAHNIFIDMVRHDRRLVPMAPESWDDMPYDVPDDGEDYSEVAVENVYTARHLLQVSDIRRLAHWPVFRSTRSLVSVVCSPYEVPELIDLSQFRRSVRRVE